MAFAYRKRKFGRGLTGWRPWRVVVHRKGGLPRTLLVTTAIDRFDSGGILYAADAAALSSATLAAIYAFTPDGAKSTFLTGLTALAGLAYAAVPEPGAWLLTITGLAALAWKRRSQSRRFAMSSSIFESKAGALSKAARNWAGGYFGCPSSTGKITFEKFASM